MTLQPIWITDDAPYDAFPDVEYALAQPNGLLAVGGDLSPQRLLAAYRRGIFPWFSDGQPILWWTPDPRAVLLPSSFRLSRSLRKKLRRGTYRVTHNQAFGEVIEACAEPRRTQKDTWITREMIDAYRCLHDLGHAHSFEAWEGDRLVGGLYGVAIGRVFFGESMFSVATDASKVAFATLVQSGFALIDCQLPSAHLRSLGSIDLPRQRFMELLARFRRDPLPDGMRAPPAWAHGAS